MAKTKNETKTKIKQKKRTKTKQTKKKEAKERKKERRKRKENIYRFYSLGVVSSSLVSQKFLTHDTE